MQLLQRLALYRPELPHGVLSRAVGNQGDTSRLERVLLRVMRGERVVKKRAKFNGCVEAERGPWKG